MIRDGSQEKAVKVTITADDVSGFVPNSKEVNALAQKAWKSVNQTFSIKGEDLSDEPSIML